MRVRESTPINERALLTRQMAADYLSVGVTAMRQFENCGEIRGIKIGSGKEKRYRRSDLDQLIERMAAGETVLDRVKRG